jgi:hypothetical protein
MESNGIVSPRDGLILDGRTHRYPAEADRHGAKSGADCIHTDDWPAGWRRISSEVNGSEFLDPRRPAREKGR